MSNTPTTVIETERIYLPLEMKNDSVIQLKLVVAPCPSEESVEIRIPIRKRAANEENPSTKKQKKETPLPMKDEPTLEKEETSAKKIIDVADKALKQFEELENKKKKLFYTEADFDRISDTDLEAADLAVMEEKEIAQEEKNPKATPVTSFSGAPFGFSFGKTTPFTSVPTFSFLGSSNSNSNGSSTPALIFGAPPCSDCKAPFGHAIDCPNSGFKRDEQADVCRVCGKTRYAHMFGNPCPPPSPDDGCPKCGKTRRVHFFGACPMK
jgi:hypothetical protein